MMVMFCVHFSRVCVQKSMTTTGDTSLCGRSCFIVGVEIEIEIHIKLFLCIEVRHLPRQHIFLSINETMGRSEQRYGIIVPGREDKDMA